MITIRFAIAQPFEQWPKLRKNRNREASARFMPECNKLVSIKINVRAGEWNRPQPVLDQPIQEIRENRRCPLHLH
jgi:hypothetical protein